MRIETRFGWLHVQAGLIETRVGQLGCGRSLPLPELPTRTPPESRYFEPPRRGRRDRDEVPGVAEARNTKKEQPPRWSLPFEPHPELLSDGFRSHPLKRSRDR
jgi:hypothetical protein